MHRRNKLILKHTFGWNRIKIMSCSTCFKAFHHAALHFLKFYVLNSDMAPLKGERSTSGRDKGDVNSSASR